MYVYKERVRNYNNRFGLINLEDNRLKLLICFFLTSGLALNQTMISSLLLFRALRHMIYGVFIKNGNLYTIVFLGLLPIIIFIKRRKISWKYSIYIRKIDFRCYNFFFFNMMIYYNNICCFIRLD